MKKKYLNKLSARFVRETLKVAKGENVLISYRGLNAYTLAKACAEEVTALGGIPHYQDLSAAAINKEIAPLSAEEVTAYGENALARMKQMQCYIAIMGDDDQVKIDIPKENFRRYRIALRAETDYRVEHLRWVMAAAPTREFAKACNMSLQQFNAFYLKACLFDYGAMARAVLPLQKALTEAEKVRVFSPAQETDLTFDLCGLKAQPCTGAANIPDGECFTAPERESANGTIRFSPALQFGHRFSSIKLTFNDGQVIMADAESPEKTKILHSILNIDDGASAIGEFAVNFNPIIQNITTRTLFDEKINGGIHLALGNAHPKTDNGNRSVIHWDLIHIQRPDFGGGELWLDGKLFRKDGLFVDPELMPLNPDNLMEAAQRGKYIARFDNKIRKLMAAF